MIDYCYARGKLRFNSDVKFESSRDLLDVYLQNPIEIKNSNSNFYNNDKREIVIPLGEYVNLINIIETVSKTASEGKIISATMDKVFVGYTDTPRYSNEYDLYKWAEENTKFDKQDLEINENNYNLNQLIEITKRKEKVINKFLKSNPD